VLFVFAALVHVPPQLTAVILLACQRPTKLASMEFPRTQIYIAVGAGLLLLFIFFGYLSWLNSQPPVLSRSAESDPLSGVPNSISLNPLRDRSSERAATEFIRGMQNGKCKEQLADWEKDYHKKYATFICNTESQHPLVAWKLADWNDDPSRRFLEYRSRRLSNLGQSGTYTDLFTVTLENKQGDWVVTKYTPVY
jgi:hypothetical protein